MQLARSAAESKTHAVGLAAINKAAPRSLADSAHYLSWEPTSIELLESSIWSFALPGQLIEFGVSAGCILERQREVAFIKLRYRNRGRE